MTKLIICEMLLQPLNIFFIRTIYAIYHTNHHIRQRLSRYVGNFCISHTLNPPVISQNNVPLHWNWLNDRGLFELAVVVVFVVRHLGVPLFLNFDQFGYASGLLSLGSELVLEVADVGRPIVPEGGKAPQSYFRMERFYT